MCMHMHGSYCISTWTQPSVSTCRVQWNRHGLQDFVYCVYIRLQVHINYNHVLSGKVIEKPPVLYIIMRT